MQSPPASRPPRSAATLAKLLQWRHSLFWTIVPAMFVVSCIGAAVLVVVATISEDARLRDELAAPKLSGALAAAVRRSTPLLSETGGPTRWCTDTLQVLADRVLAETIGDRTGDTNANGFYQAGKSGRLAVELHAAGMVCRYPSAGPAIAPGLRRQLDAVARRPGAALGEQPDGWTSVAGVALDGAGAPVLTVGVQILSPWAKLKLPRSVGKPLALFILSINALAALVLVMLLIRRIKRADQAATAWTGGELGTRINDTGRDEVSRLTRKFDLMADAMSGVIEVKQALAAAEERNRLARDLHDSAKQRAFALNLQLSAARELFGPQPDGARLLDAALSLTSQLQQDLSNLIRRQSASTIVESGFRQVLLEGLRAMLAGGDIDWSVALDEADERALAAMPRVADQLLLITMEAVANALKHAACTRCAISGERSGAMYVWRIADNGVGLDAAAARGKGMGLANMKLRADGLDDGAFAAVPGADGGTAIVVTFRMAPP